MRVIFLDSGPIGLLSNPTSKPQVVQCHEWAKDMLAAGALLAIPEICDYEVRRKLVHVGATAGLRRLDKLRDKFDFVPITSDAMLMAAELWAQARTRGTPTAPPDALDGDVILAAQALNAVEPGDVLTVATDNVGHLSRFVDAQPWETITG